MGRLEKALGRKKGLAMGVFLEHEDHQAQDGEDAGRGPPDVWALSQVNS